MATLQSLSDLNRANVENPENEAPVHVQKLDAQGRAYATGKRKDAACSVHGVSSCGDGGPTSRQKAIVQQIMCGS